MDFSMIFFDTNTIQNTYMFVCKTFVEFSKFMFTRLYLKVYREMCFLIF